MMNLGVKGLVVGLTTALAVVGCDGGDPDVTGASELALVPGPPPGPLCGPAPHMSSKIGSANTSDSYTRPYACQSWTVHQAIFTIPSSHPYRKLSVQHQFDYASLSNPEAKCLASKVEFKTERQVTVGGSTIWLPVASGSATPFYVASTKACFWHNYNGNTGPTSPGTVIERISARALRYTGSYDPVTTNVRIQSDTIP